VDLYFRDDFTMVLPTDFRPGRLRRRLPKKPHNLLIFLVLVDITWVADSFLVLDQVKNNVYFRGAKHVVSWELQWRRFQMSVTTQ
jgi:hypothetical protein